MKPLHILMAISVPIIWGGGFLFAKAAINHFPPILLMAFRFAITTLVLVWFVKPPLRLLQRIFWIALVSAAIQYSLTFTGLRDLDASTAVIIVQLEVPFGVFLAVILLKDTLTLRRILGMALAFMGVVITAGEPKLGGNLLPVLLVVGGAFSWALGQVMIKTLGAPGGFTLIAWVAVFATPQLFMSSWLFENNQVDAIMTATPLVWAAVIYLGIVMTAIGYAIWYHLLGIYAVNQVMPYLLLLPVVTVLGGVVLLGETLTTTLIFGGLLAIAGIAVITLEKSTPLPQSKNT